MTGETTLQPGDPLTSTCPDCGAPIRGRIGAWADGSDILLPGTQCSSCPHTVAELSTESDPLYDQDGHAYVYTLEADGTILVTCEGDVVDRYPLASVADWEGVNPFPVTHQAVSEAVDDQDE